MRSGGRRSSSTPRRRSTSEAPEHLRRGGCREDAPEDHRRSRTYWPGFAQAGKQDITVRQLLAHQAGLFAFDEPLEAAVVSDVDRLAGVMERQAPIWPPGERQATDERLAPLIPPGVWARLSAFGAPEVGGSMGYADPELHLSQGYVTDRMGTRLEGDPRDVALRRALVEVVMDR